MTKNILIVDDDGDFVNLLNEILTQSGYETKACTRAGDALQALQGGVFDLLILDQRMGDMSGSDFLAKMRQTDQKTPVMVVSGFLENSSAQQFVNLGVSGIFFKPLNIFALLKRVEEVFKGAVKPSGAPVTEAALKGLTRLPFGSTVGKEIFLKKVQALSGFRGNLLLVGEAGSPFEAIATQIVQKSDVEGRLMPWDPKLEKHEGWTKMGEGLTTIFVKNFGGLTAAERQAILKAARHEPPFEKAPVVRFIFCLEEELDALYEKKKVDDEFYLFLGSLELKIPRATAKQENLHQAVKSAQNTVEPFKSARVLVLDDEDLHAQMVVDLLDTAGYRSLKINNPAEALGLMKKEKFSLIITDFRMPGINGIDFVTQARTVDATMPIFIVTGNIEVPEIVRIGNMGITRLIQKPIDAAKFLQEVAAVIRP